MTQPSHLPPTSSLPDGLPTVQPPSGQMILRLFLVPFLIVAVLIGLYLLGHTLYGRFGRPRSADYFLRNLDSANADIRWRAASDLSQELPRSPRLRANGSFALELADRLQVALDESAGPEKDFAARQEGMTDAERDRVLNKEIAPRRNLITYLSACLGNFVVPVGVPQLRALATQTSGMEPEANAERRRQALFALAVLGETLKQYDQLSETDRERIREELSEAADKERLARWARPCLDYLSQHQQGKANSAGVAQTLRNCAEDDDPSLRLLAAFASNFWHGTPREEAMIEEFLARLSVDAGVGEDRLEERLAKNPDAKRVREVTKRKGYEVQVNANLALARRGSPRVRLDLLEEMLDPEGLREVFRIHHLPARGSKEPTRDEPNEARVVLTVTGTLRALPELSARRKELKLDSIKAQVEKLTKDPNASIRTEAEKASQAL